MTPFWHFFNGTAAPVNARFSYGVGFTFDNELLNDPALIDPTTGLPFEATSRFPSATSPPTRKRCRPERPPRIGTWTRSSAPRA